MRERFRIPLALVFVFSSAALVTARQSTGKPPSTGIPECDKYAAMVTACLPKMCDDERLVMEMQLGLNFEIIPKVVEIKGRQAAAEGCARDTSEALEDLGLYGCNPDRAGDTRQPMTIRLDKVRPTDTSVTMTFTGNGPTQGEQVQVEIMTSSIGRRPFTTYRLPNWKGQFVLDTASASPVSDSKGGSQGAPIRLEPQTTYCFFVESSVGNRTDYYRKGIFTTLPNK